MKIHEVIRRRREELGITRREVAAACRIGLPAYYDVEEYEEEVGAAVTLSQFRRLSEVLRLDLRRELGIRHLPDCAKGATAVKPRSINEAVRARRLAIGLSIDDAARKAEMSRDQWTAIEDSADALEELPVNAVLAIAEVVQLSSTEVMTLFAGSEHGMTDRD